MSERFFCSCLYVVLEEDGDDPIKLKFIDTTTNEEEAKKLVQESNMNADNGRFYYTGLDIKIPLE